MAVESVEDEAVHAALEEVAWPQTEISINDITEIETGVNDIYTFATGLDTPARAVCKFATFSVPSAFQAGVTATHLLAEHTEIPVPGVYALRTDPPDLPAFQVVEFLPGDSIPSHPEPGNPGPARALGRVIRELGSIPSEMTSGYGWIHPENEGLTASGETSAEGEYETCSEWCLEYGLELYDDLPEHESLAAVAQDVQPFLRENSHRFPDEPARSIVLTDFGPGNLLARNGRVSEAGSLEELTGLIDLERAKLGPMEFNSVNAEFLMQRWIDEPQPVISALYEPLPFGPDVPRRDLYRLLAMGREVPALELFYEEGSEIYESRGRKLAREIEQILE
jgi:aminoglycoside phosphotransferase (APT) family kinase protein